jgi:hypothetical protein
MTVASDILRQLTDPGTAAALSQGASALDALPGLQGQVADLTAQNAALTAKVAELEAELHPGPTPPPTPSPTPPPAASTIFGMNLGSRTIADRLRQFGRVPKVKAFSLIDVSALPEKRAQVCVPWDQTKLANGDYDATIAAYLEKQVAAGARFVGVTNRQEPEDFLKVSQANVDVWKAATKRLAGLVKAHGKAGVTYTVPCLIAPHKETGMVVPDAWMLTPDDLGGQDWCVWSWDDYGNPFGAKNYSNDVYATPYPDGATIAGQAFPLLQKFGWTRWGVSEFNTPFRKDLAAPGDPKHLLRIQYLDDYVQACLHAPAQIGPPMWMDLWEEHGTRYDQTFTVQAEYDWWKGYVAKSA